MGSIFSTVLAIAVGLAVGFGALAMASGPYDGIDHAPGVAIAAADVRIAAAIEVLEHHGAHELTDLLDDVVLMAGCHPSHTKCISGAYDSDGLAGAPAGSLWLRPDHLDGSTEVLAALLGHELAHRADHMDGWRHGNAAAYADEFDLPAVEVYADALLVEVCGGRCGTAYLDATVLDLDTAHRIAGGRS
ncbi:MAG: hypothetical protein GY898_00010 [Proteobacteria bacterium]|nr:hypothetical protein [Actinomycetes bacterium]MCP4867085.1 hypothetical protein [Pseudomonadota bacterium]